MKYSLPADHAQRMKRVSLALDGLSVGDAFGERFFFPPNLENLIAQRALPGPPWRYTDDTEMALGIADVLAECGGIDQDKLAFTFARRYAEYPGRGYGRNAMDILKALLLGMSWRVVAPRSFDGQGSLGNGAAMRAAPVGAYFADDPDAVIGAARASAEVTHSHPEGIAGAIAVALAAAWAWNSRKQKLPADDLFAFVLGLTPGGATRAGIEAARQLAAVSTQEAADRLGSGWRVTAPDTVPFCLWCAARHLASFEEAMWTTVAGLGDRDTTCAIVGGIVALSAGRQSIPDDWLNAREKLKLGGTP